MELVAWTTLIAMTLAPAVGEGDIDEERAGQLAAPGLTVAPEAIELDLTADLTRFRDTSCAEGPASALVFGPLSATSPDGSLHVTIVASRSSGARPRSVHALIARPGTFVQWVLLPIEELPESVIAPDAETFVCVQKDELDRTSLTTFDGDAHLTAQASLDSLMPAGARRRDGSQITLAANDMGPCLAVPMDCGSVAFIEVAVMPGHDYEVCSIELSPRLACGIDTWLARARDLARDGDAEAAQVALEAAIEAEPEDPRGYRQLARLHEKAGDHEAQLRCLQQGIDRIHADAKGIVTDRWQVGTPAAHLALEYVETTRDVFGDAQAHDALLQTMAFYPCMEQAILLYAELLLDAGQEEAALEALRRALARLSADADLAAANHDVGRFLRREGLGSAALEFLENAYALGQRSEFLIRGISDLHGEQGEPGRAAEWLAHLAEHWRESTNGDSELERRLRGYQRLAELELEIETLWIDAAATTTR